MNERYTLQYGLMEFAPDEGEWVHWSDYSNMRAKYQAELYELKSRLDSLEKDAARWDMVPAVAEDHQINLMQFYRDIDAAMQSRKGGE